MPGIRHIGPGKAGQKYNLEVKFMLRTGKKSCLSGKEAAGKDIGAAVTEGSQAKNRYAMKMAEMLPTISAMRPQMTAYLEFLMPTEPKYTART